MPKVSTDGGAANQSHNEVNIRKMCPSAYLFIFVLLGKTSVDKPLLEYMSKKLNTR